jgi:hypothetical protein
MGGGGGDSSPYSGRDAERLAQEAARQLQRQEFDQAVNDYLAELLAEFNERDVDVVGERLAALVQCLGGENVDVDRLLFGGSVAKHTYVDGLSDVDALLVLRDVSANSPTELVQALADRIRANRPSDAVDVSAGDLAVTVTYADSSQIQVLPAQEVNGRLRIASEDGTSWREIRPRAFAEKLTQVNQAAGGHVIPAIKLAKAVLQNLPDERRPSGYHVEAIAVDAFRAYNGPKNRLATLRHLLDHASEAVLRPTGDITRQSVHIDGHLGPANSELRRGVSNDIRRIVLSIDHAASVDEIRDLFD